MTHEETSLRTKTALCDGLKELMRRKPFSKITVSELIKTCNVNRKTFYYHFEDIYDLLKWMLEQEAVAVVRQYDLTMEYRDVFDFVVDYVNENSFILNCIYDAVGRDRLKRFLYQDFVGIVETLIRSAEAHLGATLEDEFRHFLCDLYTEGLAGSLINLFRNPEQYTREKLAEYFSVIIHSSIPAVILSRKKETAEGSVDG